MGLSRWKPIPPGPPPAAGDFGLSTNTVSSVSVANNAVVLTTNTKIDNGTNVTVTCTPGTNRIKDNWELQPDSTGPIPALAGEPGDNNV